MKPRKHQNIGLTPSFFAYKGTVANSGVDQGINYGLTPFEVSATTNCGTILTAENIKL